MAIFLAQMKPLCRRDGRSAVAAAAYRAGDRLEDARTGLVHDYSRRSGVTHAEIFTPDGGPAERAQLWNAAELAEKRKDARTGREWVLALPAELDAEQRRELARAFASEIVERYGVAVDLAIHEPGKEGDERNHHAHVFATTRQVSRDESGALSLGGKAALELSDAQRRAAGLGPAAEEVTALRQLWERLANEALERAGHEARIDSRSLEAQGIDREPTAHLGPAATAMERRGEPSHLGEHNRQVEARNAGREAVQAEIIDLRAERDRRAQEAQKQQEREEAEAAAKAEADRLEKARQERAQDVARWTAMDPMERRLELSRLRLPALDSLIERDKAVKAGQRRQQEAEALRDLAAQEAQAWRAQSRGHRARAWLHDRGFRSAELGALESRREETRSAAEEAAQSLEATRKATAARLTEAQRPAQERFKAFREVDARKREEEAQALKEAEEQAKAAQVQEEAQRAAREAARLEADRQERIQKETRAEERRRMAVEQGGATFRAEVRRDPEAMRAHLLKTYLPHKMTHRERETWAERMQEIERGGKEPETPKAANPPPPAKAELEPPKPPERPAPKPPKRDRSWDRDRD